VGGHQALSREHPTEAPQRPNKTSSGAGYTELARIGPVGSIGPNMGATPASVRPAAYFGSISADPRSAHVFGLLIWGRE
jgi:hypothetical protein